MGATAAPCGKQIDQNSLNYISKVAFAALCKKLGGYQGGWACDILPLTLASILRAIELAKHFQLSLYEANIVSIELIYGADVLFLNLFMRLSYVPRHGQSQSLPHILRWLIPQHLSSLINTGQTVPHIPFTKVSVNRFGIFQIRA